MKYKIQKIIIVALIAFIAMESIAIAVDSRKVSYNKSSFALDQIKAKGISSQISGKISTIQALGPLSAVALSPFFGITCLSGASMLSEKGVIKTDNYFLKGNKALNNPLVFMVFLILTIATSLPKLTTVTKAFAQLTDQAETYAGIISYLVIYAVANSQLPAEYSQVEVFHAGIFSFTLQTLLMAACTVNIIVINTVKYFFEFLAFLSPVPMLDAAFEIANKAIAAGLAMLYIFNPFVSFMVNLVLFLLCLMIFGWAKRRVKYLRAILTDAAWAGMMKNIFGRKDFDPDRKARIKLADIIETDGELKKVFPAKKIKPLKYKKKQLLYLVQSQGKSYLAKPRFLRPWIIKDFDVAGLKVQVDSGLLSNSLKYCSDSGDVVYKLLFSKVYDSTQP